VGIFQRLHTTFYLSNNITQQLAASVATLQSSTYGGLCDPCISTDRFGQRAFTVAVPQLWNQMPVTILATSANISNCFKQALQMLLFQSVEMMTAPPINCCGGGGSYSKQYNINITAISGIACPLKSPVFGVLYSDAPTQHSECVVK